MDPVDRRSTRATRASHAIQGTADAPTLTRAAFERHFKDPKVDKAVVDVARQGVKEAVAARAQVPTPRVGKGELRETLASEDFRRVVGRAPAMVMGSSALSGLTLAIAAATGAPSFIADGIGKGMFSSPEPAAQLASTLLVLALPAVVAVVVKFHLALAHAMGPTTTPAT